MAPMTEYSPVAQSARRDLTKQRACKSFIAMPFALFLLSILAFRSVVAESACSNRKDCVFAGAAPHFSPPDGPFRRGPKAIAAACNATLYPALCISSLMSDKGALLADPPGLVAISTSLALRDVNSTYGVALSLSKGKGSRLEIAAVTDCVELMGDAKDQLRLATSRLHNLDLKRARLQLSDVQTWVSAALTYETTCSDGFEGMKGTIAQQMVQKEEALSKMLSIALALVAHLSDHLFSWHS